MSTQQIDDGAQLSFNFPDAAPQGNGGGREASPPNVVCFVDAKTREVRRRALERLRASGIFNIPDGMAAR
ncbi:hypothetical protein MCP1_280015 [Candidatus Terasakiella magnetica]|nr:hypothetical protein MCP1_280015 [Candidatus Terasakiella magnetica]